MKTWSAKLSQWLAIEFTVHARPCLSVNCSAGLHGGDHAGVYVFAYLFGFGGELSVYDVRHENELARPA